MIAFGCILEGPSKESINDMINQGIGLLLRLLNCKNDKVIYYTLETLRRISELYPD